MSDIFETIGKRIAETMEVIGKKAGDTVDITKEKKEIYDLKRDNDRDFMEIGKLIYETYKAGDTIDNMFLAYCDEIAVRQKEIEEHEEKITRIKGE